MPTAPTTSDELLSLVHKSGVVSAARLANLSDLPADPQKAAATLVAQGVLTRFQAQQLLAGRHKGFRVGSYVIHDLLGRGGMGAVYLAEHMELRRKVAIKVLVPGRDNDQKLALERFLREARAAAALDHPNIVRIFDVCRHGESPYLVMEFVEGETLQKMLDRDGAIPYPIATEYVAQAAAGLQHAHEKGFVHRDIKPANLILDRSGTIKLLDMGLARSSRSDDKLTEQLDKGAIVGTADYIAPEQAMNRPDIDIRADIYSLGATLFALIIGKPPFEGNTTQKLMQHQMKAPPALSSFDGTLPHGLGAVVNKMMAKNPANRYHTPAEVIAALAPWMKNSARILAGLSHTNLAQGADLQATLSEISLGGTSRRLGTVAPPALEAPSSVDVDMASGLAESSVTKVAAINGRMKSTTRIPATPVTAPDRSRSRVVLYTCLAIGLMVAGVVTGLFAFGGKKPTDDTGPHEHVQVPAQATTPPSAREEPTAPPKTVALYPTSTQTQAQPPLFRLDLSQQKPFSILCGLTPDPNDANKKNYRPISQMGAPPPPGWSARPWNVASEIEFFSDSTGDQTTLGIRNVNGPPSAMLFAPQFFAPEGACRLRFEYRADVREGKFALKFKPSDSRTAWEVARPPITASSWRTEELEVDLRGAFGGFFEFHNTDERPTATVRIRSLEITSARITPERVYFRLDAAELPDFQNTRQGFKLVTGNEPPAIPGIYFAAWKAETQSEWRCGPFAGARAIVFANVNEVSAAQIGLELEKANGLSLKFNPGSQIRVRLVYRTSGNATGRAYFQTADLKSVLGTTNLPNSNHDWSTADILATRGDQPLRFLIDNKATGAENRLAVRSITISEVARVPGPTTPPPAPKQSPDDLSRWTEGRTLYKLDVAAIPPFRVQKDNRRRLGGDPESLPSGIGCQCWQNGSIGEFECRPQEGYAALGITNLRDNASAQFYFELEKALQLALQPAKPYRVKVEYQTINTAAGQVNIQTTPNYITFASGRLTNTGGKWATASVSFVRPSASDSVALRMTIDNTTTGDENTLWIRTVEVVELVPPNSR